jgi:putative oxidoreductase
MFKKIFQTSDDMTTFILRVTLGIVMFPHGAQKMLGWYGHWSVDQILSKQN